jgi:hypothetical protein
MRAAARPLDLEGVVDLRPVRQQLLHAGDAVRAFDNAGDCDEMN